MSFIGVAQLARPDRDRSVFELNNLSFEAFPSPASFRWTSRQTTTDDQGCDWRFVASSFCSLIHVSRPFSMSFSTGHSEKRQRKRTSPNMPNGLQNSASRVEVLNCSMLHTTALAASFHSLFPGIVSCTPAWPRSGGTSRGSIQSVTILFAYTVIGGMSAFHQDIT